MTLYGDAVLGMEETNMKIATITYSWCQNWGAVLQAHALVQYLRQNGHHANVIDYRGFDEKVIYTVKSIPDGIYSILNYTACKRRVQKFAEFRKNSMFLSRRCDTTEQLEALEREFDAFITGSDQVWNVGLGVCDDFYLQFIKDREKCISYAASFGVSEIPEKHQADTIRGINHIAQLSVREKSGAEIINKLTGRECSIVLDPVFLLPVDYWKGFCDKCDLPHQKYVFVYPTQITNELLTAVKTIRKKTGLQVISPFKIPGAKVVKDIGPEEFVGYIRNAEYVIASSFHATAFSVIFQKNLCVVPHKQTGARVVDLLEALNLSEQCLWNGTNGIIDADYMGANQILQNKVEESKAFLLDALDRVGGKK